MRRRTVVRRLAVLILLGVVGATSLSVAKVASAAPAFPADQGATIMFRKVFKGSSPEFVEIKIDGTGVGTYDIRQMSDDASPEPFQLGAPLAHRIFDLAEKLNDFAGADLDTHHRIANLGEKTFRYEHGAESHAVTFNYTVDATATQLLDVFEGITRQLTDASDLEHALHYDRLGVNDALLQIEKDFDAKLLPEPERLLPLLAQISADTRVIDMARRRANDLSARIQTPAK
jgi:hypothetical protein